jgi:hypothetical protein
LTEEEKQQRTEGKKPVQAAKAKAERALTRLTKKLDALATPPNEGDFETDEDYQAALANNRAERRETIKELLQLQADSALRGTAVGERVKAALARPDITAKEKADLKAGIVNAFDFEHKLQLPRDAFAVLCVDKALGAVPGPVDRQTQQTATGALYVDQFKTQATYRLLYCLV